MDESQKRTKLPQILNHFEDNRGICTKTGLIRSLKQYYQTNDDSCKKKKKLLTYIYFKINLLVSFRLVLFKKIKIIIIIALLMLNS